MALIDDWKDATQRDTMARTISQGLTTVAKPLNQNFGSARQPDIPAADAAAYSRQQAKPVATPGAPQAGTTPAAQNSVTTSQKGIGFGASAAAGGLTSNPFNVGKTSQPGISKVTGGSLSSPLYTNQSDASQAASGLGQQTIGSGVATGQSGPAAGITASPFGDTNTLGGAGISGGLPEGLARQARENAVRQSMIDSQPSGGIGVLNGTDNNVTLDKMRRDSQINGLIEASKYGTRSQRANAAGIANAMINADTQRAVEDSRQQGIAAGLDLQRRGQNLSHGAQMAQMGLTARSHDLSAQQSNARLGIDMARFNAERDDAAYKRSLGNDDWRLQVTPSTRDSNGNVTAGSIYKYNQRTGDVQRVDDGGGQNDARAQALAAIKAGAPRDAVNQRLKAMGIDAV